MDSKISTKVGEYESFLNDVLKEDLKILEKQLKELNDKLTDWYILKKTITDIMENNATFKTFTNIGCGISYKTKIEDVSVINVNIGSNVYLEMTLDDANKFCDVKINLYKKQTEHIQSQTIKVKAHIKLVLLGIQEIQNV